MNYFDFLVCCIGKCVVVDDGGFWIMFKQILDEVCTDKSGTTGEEDGVIRGHDFGLL